MSQPDSGPFTPARPLHLASTIPAEPEIVVVTDQSKPPAEETDEGDRISPEEIDMLLSAPAGGDDDS